MIKLFINTYYCYCYYSSFVRFEKGSYPTEPIFVQSMNNLHGDDEIQPEDDGVILSLVTNGETYSSFLLILDAKSFKEVARVMLPAPVPFGFHGQFFPNIQ